MGTKDWILLLVPILCNGVIIFILQKCFEKKQTTKTIKGEYASILRQKIDSSLALCDEVERLRAQSEIKGDLLYETIDVLHETIKQCIASVEDVYSYFLQNEIVFKKSFGKKVKQMYATVVDSKKCSDKYELYRCFRKIEHDLKIIKKDCITLHF